MFLDPFLFLKLLILSQSFACKLKLGWWQAIKVNVEKMSVGALGTLVNIRGAAERWGKLFFDDKEEQKLSLNWNRNCKSWKFGGGWSKVGAVSICGLSILKKYHFFIIIFSLPIPSTGSKKWVVFFHCAYLHLPQHQKFRNSQFVFLVGHKLVNFF